MIEKLEILPVSLLETEWQIITELKELAHKLKLEFGWHYLLDLSWIIRQIEEIQEKRIIDAGAGIGVMQWYLAERGAKVISVDLESRVGLPSRFRRRFDVSGLREQDLADSGLKVVAHQLDLLNLVKFLAADVLDYINNQFFERRDNLGSMQNGQVVIYNQNLADLRDISSDSIDVVVAVSSLEHNSPEFLIRIVGEIMRVLKPGGALFATLAATKDIDWYHEPSGGWCYSEATLRRIFAIPSEVRSNYSQFDQLFEQLKVSDELRNNLASFYFRSGDNGMPWGIWDPQYQPVGICKIKQEIFVADEHRAS